MKQELIEKNTGTIKVLDELYLLLTPVEISVFRAVQQRLHTYIILHTHFGFECIF